jgi:hypothetical protein
MPVRRIQRLGGADLDEIALPGIGEECGLQLFLVVLREDRPHQALT